MLVSYLRSTSVPRYVPSIKIQIATRLKMASNTTTRIKRHNNINNILFKIL